MDKVIRVIQGVNRVLTCGKKYSLKLTNGLTGGMEDEGRERERGRKLRERSSTFSLGFSGDQTGRF